MFRKKISEAIVYLTKKRVLFRKFPVYRIIERAIRATVWTGFFTAAAYLYEGFLTSNGFIELLQRSWQVGWIAALDKLKNEYGVARRKHKLDRVDSWISLFEKD